MREKRLAVASRMAPSIWVGARSLPEASACLGATIAVFQRKVPFLAVWTLCFIACGFAYAKLVHPDFIATTQILLQPRVIVNDGPEDLRHFHQFMIDGEQCESELRVIRSEQLLYRVFKALELNRSGEIGNGPDGFWSYIGTKIDQFENILDPGHETLLAFYAFSRRVRARRLGLSYVIEISYRAQRPEQAMRVVNSIASAYAGYRLRGAFARDQRRGAYLEGRLAALHEQVLAVEAGTRFGAVPEISLPDAEVRLLGPASLPLGSVYPKMIPIILLAMLFGSVSGTLVILMTSATQSVRPTGPTSVSHFPKRVRIA